MDKLNCFNHLDYNNLSIGEYINKGSSGKVYKSKYEDKNIICKCFNKDNYSYDQWWIDDVYNELKIYDILNKTNGCCECLGYTLNDDCIYLLLKDYDTINNLYDYLNDDKHWNKYNRQITSDEYYYRYKSKEWIYKLNRDKKIELTKQLIEIIKNLHDKNIVHCDLKTSNILYNEKTNNLILIDFGASCYLSNEKSKEIDCEMGTMGYACFTLNEEGICSKKSDIYSLGVCIIEIWCGAIWNTGITNKKCRNEVLSSLRKLEEKEPELGKELRKCVNIKVEKRPLIQNIQNKIYNII